MKISKLLVSALLVSSLAFLFNPLTRAHAQASNSENTSKTFFEIVVDNISKVFSGIGKAEASNEEKDLGQNRIALLRFLNAHELEVRSGMSGVDLYLKREQGLESLKKIKSAIEASDLSQKNKTEAVSYLEDVKRVYLMDLVDSPQEKLKSLILGNFDQYESMVFKISEDEAKSLLNSLDKEGFNVNSVNKELSKAK